MRSIHLPFARWVTSFLSTFFLLLPSAHAARDFMHRKRLRLWFIHVIHRFIHNMLITLFITVDNSPQKIAMLPWNADTVEVPVMWIVWITRNGAQGVDSANSFFIKRREYPMPAIPFDSHIGFYFPPAASKDWAVKGASFRKLSFS